MALVDDKDVLKYEKRRYRAADQKLINRLEQRMVTEMINRLRIEEGRVLDLPCGYGRFSTLLVGKRIDVICADVSAAMVGRAREQVEAAAGDSPAPGKGMYAVADIRRLPFRDRSLDATFTMRLFHHGFARDAMAEILRELARVSRRWVILSYYRKNPVHGLFRRLKGFTSRIKMMSDAEFEAELAQTPLVIRSRRRVIPWFHAQTLVVLEKRK